MSAQNTIRDEECGIGYLITVSFSTLDKQDLVGFGMVDYDVRTDHDYTFRLSLPGDSPEKTNEYAFSTIKKVIRKMSEKSDWIKESKLKKEIEITKKEEKKAAKKK